jgi:phosphatidylglycerol:prolipoprotein diacylglycerol transferase
VDSDADMAVGPLLFGQTIGRFGNFANGEVHGVPTFTPTKVSYLSGTFTTWWESYQKLGIDLQSKFKEIVPWGVVFPNDTPAGQEFHWT